MPAILIPFGLGTILGIAITGGMRIADRQARASRYRPLPSGHRKVTPARPLVDRDGTTWRSLPREAS